jgi:hypothetical protein
MDWRPYTLPASFPLVGQDRIPPEPTRLRVRVKAGRWGAPLCGVALTGA